MSSLGIFNKETKTYQKVAGTAEAAVLDKAMSDTSENPVQNKVIKKGKEVIGTGKYMTVGTQKWLEVKYGIKTGYCSKKYLK